MKTIKVMLGVVILLGIINLFAVLSTQDLVTEGQDENAAFVSGLATICGN